MKYMYRQQYDLKVSEKLAGIGWFSLSNMGV